MAYAAVAKAKYAKIAPRKSRLVADLIRGKEAGEAQTILRFSPKKKGGRNHSQGSGFRHCQCTGQTS